MYTLEDIQAVDMEVANAITDEFERQNSHIELIASENWVSKAVMSAMGSVLTNKYTDIYLLLHQKARKPSKTGFLAFCSIISEYCLYSFLSL
jgi:hypothetical protein